jgi:cell division transport system permease protein
MATEKKDTQAKLGGKQRFRRRYLTWMRMARYGANNFSRNAWLTTAATAVMTITLLIIFMTSVARQALVGTVDELRSKVDYSIFLRTDIKDSDAEAAKAKLTSLSNVTSVTYITTEQAKADYIKDKKPSAEELQLLSELDTNPFIPSLKVVVKDPNNTGQLADAVEQDEVVKDAVNTDPKWRPTFTGERRKVIDTINGWATIAERGGLAAGLVFVVISMLIIFNTIRMAIFNRKDEIEMMKLIGADKGFIRGPFVVEAVMYGFIAALIATALGYVILYYVEKPLAGYGIAIGATLDTFTLFAPLVLLVMILIGAVIGNFSSRLAVRRYLKV